LTDFLSTKEKRRFLAGNILFMNAPNGSKKARLANLSVHFFVKFAEFCFLLRKKTKKIYKNLLTICKIVFIMSL